MKYAQLLGFFLLLTLIVLPILAAQENNTYYTEHFCEEKEQGIQLLGDDYFIICEENFVDEYYEGYEEFKLTQGINISEEEIRIRLEPPAQSPDRIPETIFEQIILEKQGIQPTKTITLETQQLLEKEITTEEQLRNQNTSEYEQETKQTTSPPQQNELTYQLAQPLDQEESKNPELRRYFIYLAIGLFILSILYVLLHHILTNEADDNHLNMAVSYIHLFKEQHYSEEQITNYFLEKGYEKHFIKRALKRAQDKKP